MSLTKLKTLRGAAVMACVAALAVACGESDSVVDPSSAFSHADPSGNDPIVGHFEVCKAGPTGITADFNVVVDNLQDDTKDANFSITLTEGECQIVATVETEGIPNFADVTVEEVPVSGTQLVGVETRICTGDNCTIQSASNPVFFQINNDQGITATFTNDFLPPPPGGEGCTPGYWKQPHHFDSWGPTGFNTGDDFDTTFGVDLFNPDITLLEALNAKGGHENRLARHGTAALLSAAHPDVSYGLTVAEVIAAVQAGDADLLEENNEQFCPLN